MSLDPAGSPSRLLLRDRGVGDEAATFPRRDLCSIASAIARFELGDDGHWRDASKDR